MMLLRRKNYKNDWIHLFIRFVKNKKYQTLSAIVMLLLIMCVSSCMISVYELSGDIFQSNVAPLEFLV